MKNTVILALFLFIASISFVACDGKDGTNGVDGIIGPSGISELGFVKGQHGDTIAGNVLVICPVGLHRHLNPDGSEDDMCRTDAGYDEDGHDIDMKHAGSECIHPEHDDPDNAGSCI